MENHDGFLLKEENAKNNNNKIKIKNKRVEESLIWTWARDTAVLPQ